MRPATQPLLDRANDDLVTAQLEGLPDMSFGQHIHASIEKNFKALLNELTNGYPYIHDLKGLASLLQTNGETIPSVSINFNDLNFYSSKLRYEGIEYRVFPDRNIYIEAVITIRDYVLARIAQISGI